MLEPIDTMTALESLQSTVCPACGESKASRQSMCRGCYFALPKRIRDSLYNRMRSGYEEALTEAMHERQATKVHMPEVT